MSYEKQKVIVDTVQDDGTYYSDTLQKDTMISLGAEYERKLSERVALTPSLSIKMKGSNQNYQHFAMATSSVPVQYLAQYYDYNEIILAVPVAVVLSKKWDFFAAPEIDLKSYSKRPPRNKDNEFISGKQKNNLFLLSLGFTLKPNDITRTTFFYTFQNQTSNMEFEKYLPYNYSGHFVGISFNYTY